MLVGGTTHYAKNRSAFTDYRRTRCEIRNSLYGGSVRVSGIGTVKLEVTRAPNDPRTYTLVLDDVLHIPDSICNGVSIDTLSIQEGRSLGMQGMKFWDSRTKEPLFYGERYCGLFRVVLAGRPQGETYLTDGGIKFLSIHASTEDLVGLRKLWRTYREYKRLQEDIRLKQQALKKQGSTRQNDTTSTTPTPNPAVNNRNQDLGKGEQKTKTPTKLTPRTPPNTRRCWDWMMVSGSAHYARNRSSFSDYRRTRGQATLSTSPGAGVTQVLGIGTVKLNMIRGPDDPRTYTLVLENVLHIPSAICNGISISLLHVKYDVMNRRVFDSRTKEPLFYGKKYCGLARAVVAGDPQGETYMDDETVYMLSIHATDEDLKSLFRKTKHRVS